MTNNDVQAERTRCAVWCEHMARMLDRRAAALRAEGTFTYRTWTFKKRTAVMPGWEREAKVKEEAAKLVRKIEGVITEGLQPKPLSSGL